MPLLDIIKDNSAIRSFAQEPVDRATVGKLIDAAVLAPTAMHLEPWVFVVIQDQSVLKELSEASKAYTIATADRLPEEHRERLVNRSKDADFNVFYNAGTAIAIYGKPMGEFVEADCWMAAQNLMLQACELGLGCCVIGLSIGALNGPAMKKKLGVDDNLTAYVSLIVGKPSDTKPTKTRKAPEIIWL